MQEPADQTKNKIDNKKNCHEGAALENEWRGLPDLSRVSRSGNHKSNSRNESNDQTQKRKDFAEKTPEKPSKTEEGQQADENQVDPIHKLKPLTRVTPNPPLCTTRAAPESLTEPSVLRTTRQS